MRVLRIVGIIVLVLGALLIGSFFSTNINPDVTAANFGILALVLGTLILGADFFRKRARSIYQTSGAGRPVLVTFGWTILSAGLLISLLGFLLINLGVVTLPSNEPKLLGAIFTFVGFASILVKAELPSLNPSKLSTQQSTLFLAIASTLTAVNGYISLTYPEFWWAGLAIGIIGAIILSIKELVEGVSATSIGSAAGS